MEGHKEIHVDYIPECDICGSINGIYDAKTPQGPWANMCPRCFKENECKLGLGVGQKRIMGEKK